MAEIKFAIAIVDDHLFPIIASVDVEKNGLIRLGKVGVGADDSANQEWFESSLEFLDAYAPNPFEHVTVREASPNDPAAGTSARAYPWYATFESADNQLWVARFFKENIPGSKPGYEGVYVLTEAPENYDPDDLNADLRPRRSAVMSTRGAAGTGSGAAARADHGSTQGNVREDW